MKEWYMYINMAILKKIFGESAAGENGLRLFGRLAWRAEKIELGQTMLWEKTMLPLMGFVMGVFIGAGVAAGFSYATDTLPTKAEMERSMAAEKAAPGAYEGGAVGALGVIYCLFVHAAMMDALLETRRQTAQKPSAPKL
ncbi:MAG TPA: hypothetical protein VIF12_01575 [Micavibrio sp.]